MAILIDRFQPAEGGEEWVMMDTEARAALGGYAIRVVDALPEAPDANTIYFVKG